MSFAQNTYEIRIPPAACRTRIVFLCALNNFWTFRCCNIAVSFVTVKMLQLSLSCCGFLLTLVVLCHASDDHPVVTTESGKVRGYVGQSYDGRDFFGFRAIPFGKAERFQPPEPADPWEDVFEATEFGPQCPQFNMLTRAVEGDENCLVINVYTPKLTEKTNELLPVLVFIHGGGFVIGTGSHLFYGPQKLMDQDVVLVTFNYRLGILGFFNTEDEESQGNYGMLDQVRALEWVKENIAKFGGNANQVTIFGESAGGASVVYHLLSPLSKGLFHRAIAQSGTSINNWGFQEKPLHWAKLLAGKLECPIDTTKKLKECFKSKTVYELIRRGIDLQVTTFAPHYAAPSVEKHGGKAFLPDDPLILMKDKRIASNVPLIIGLLEDEGFPFYKEAEKRFKSYGEKYFATEFKPSLVNLQIHPVDPITDDYVDLIFDEYYEDKDVENRDEFEKGLVEIYSDATFKVNIEQTVRLFAAAGLQMHVYLYTHRGERAFAELFGGAPGKYAGHADELFLQFNWFFAQLARLNEADTEVKNIINTLWTSFARGEKSPFKVGDKEIKWPLYDPKKPSYLEINQTPKVVDGVLSDKFDFWLRTIPKWAHQQKFRKEL